jgi:hypothetical protein
MESREKPWYNGRCRWLYRQPTIVSLTSAVDDRARGRRAIVEEQYMSSTKSQNEPTTNQRDIFICGEVEVMTK